MLDHDLEKFYRKLSSNNGEMVKARMAEEKAREMNLDLRLPSVSGRLHALFDLQVSLDDEIAASNPEECPKNKSNSVTTTWCNSSIS